MNKDRNVSNSIIYGWLFWSILLLSIIMCDIDIVCNTNEYVIDEVSGDILEVCKPLLRNRVCVPAKSVDGFGIVQVDKDTDTVKVLMK